jgi:hypothetical protein
MSYFYSLLVLEVLVAPEGPQHVVDTDAGVAEHGDGRDSRLTKGLVELQ